MTPNIKKELSQVLSNIGLEDYAGTDFREGDIMYKMKRGSDTLDYLRSIIPIVVLPQIDSILTHKFELVLKIKCSDEDYGSITYYLEVIDDNSRRSSTRLLQAKAAGYLLKSYIAEFIS